MRNKEFIENVLPKHFPHGQLITAKDGVPKYFVVRGSRYFVSCVSCVGRYEDLEVWVRFDRPSYDIDVMIRRVDRVLELETTPLEALALIEHYSTTTDDITEEA